MDDKITIIEGPPPIFDEVRDGWALGLHDSLGSANVGVTRVRTFNGAALVERCHRAWRSQGSMQLEYRAPDGLAQQSPILAARHVELDEGQLLLLWVRLGDEQAAMQPGFGDDETSDDDDPDTP
jgi:hypothetical protein